MVHRKSALHAALMCAVLLCAVPASAGADTTWTRTRESGATVLRAAGRAPIRLVYPHEDTGEPHVLGVAWDGRIWYARTDEAKGSGSHYLTRIEVIASNGAARRIVSFPRDIACVGGSLSPDAKYLAYATQREVTGSKQEPPISVFIARSDGRGARRIATVSYPGEAPAWVYRPAWSPDSKRVAIPVRVRGRNRIALVSVRTGKMTYLAVPTWGDVTGPDWSPDGRSIAYSCEDRRWRPRQGEGTDWTSFDWFPETEKAEDRENRKSVRPASIWVTDLRSGKSRPVTKTPKVDTADILPRWSPGGTRLAYARAKWYHQTEDLHYWWLDLRVVDADGTKDRMVRDWIKESGGGPVPASAAEGDMRWLPDGERIVFRDCPEGAEGRATGLMLAEVDGPQFTALTPGMTVASRMHLQDSSGHKYDATLLAESFGLSPGGRYAVAAGGLEGTAGGLWRVPIPQEATGK